MFIFVIGALFSVHFTFHECEGQIISPPDGSELFVLNGSMRIEWSLQDGLTINYRSWTFKRNSSADVHLGSISSTGKIDIATKLYDVDIEKPATLVLNNVNASYEGTYEFTLLSPVSSTSTVVVTVPVKPNVRINCSDPTTVKSLDLTCVCKSEGGNPPANLTWYDENGTQIGNTSYRENVLTLTKMTNQDSGKRYTCKGQSYILTDEKSFEVKVRPNYKPIKTKITVPEEAYFGKRFNITCDSDGQPAPSFTIIHNNTIIIVSNKTIVTYTKDVQYNDAGIYTCIAKNLLGNDSDSGNLTVKEYDYVWPSTRPSKRPPTKQPTKQPTPPLRSSQSPETTASEESKGSETEWFIVIMSLLGVVIIGILLSYIVWRSCRKFRSSKHQSNPEPQTTEVDPTYQGLDLNKMNKEDNYQSLTGNYAASNDVGNEDESAYTELKKIRDVENQYQSLS